MALARVIAVWLMRRELGRLLPVLAVCAYFTLVHAALWAEVRYSEPLHPFLAVILAAAWVKPLPEGELTHG